MRRCNTRWRLARTGFALGVLVLASACVTRGTYREVAGERDRLRVENGALKDRVERLSATRESLDAERVKLIDEMEDLRQAQATLERDVRKLRRTEAELATSLAASNAELESRGEEIHRLRSTYDGLVQDLEAEVAEGQIEIQQLRDGLELSLTQDVLFASGSARLNKAGAAVLAKVADRLRKIPYNVQVKGHTDNIPIRSTLAQRYPTNWELAGARASEVVRLLAQGGVDPARLSSVSRGEFEPRASNDTAEGRSRNRRIEITLLPALPDPGVPAAPAEKSPGS